MSIWTKHPNEVGETYWQHFRAAFWISKELILLGLFAAVHAIFPFIAPNRINKKLMKWNDIAVKRYETIKKNTT